MYLKKKCSWSLSASSERIVTPTGFLYRRFISGRDLILLHGRFSAPVVLFFIINVYLLERHRTELGCEMLWSFRFEKMQISLSKWQKSSPENGTGISETANFVTFLVLGTGQKDPPTRPAKRTGQHDRPKGPTNIRSVSRNPCFIYKTLYKF